jgi:hypothetical protein
MADDEVLARAFRAVNKAMGRTNAGDPVILYRSRRICLLLPETATVARIAPAINEKVKASAREVAVSRYQSEKARPLSGRATRCHPYPMSRRG